MRSTSKYISFIICGNGYGHLKRVLNVSVDCLQIDPACHITLHCPPGHLDSARQFPNFQNGNILDRITFDSSLAINEINWLKKDAFSHSRYRQWRKELREHPLLRSADMVVSDNHVCPLWEYPKTILMASFLWHDVFDGQTTHVEMNQTIEQEKELLATLRPFMISVDDMVMPGVRQQTQAIEFPWFCHKSEFRKKEASRQAIKKILVTGGGTELINDYLASIAVELTRYPDVAVYGDAAIVKRKEVQKAKIPQFSFEEPDFASLDLLVCRPGLGIITDAVQYNIPLCAIYDMENKEINHNASRLESLGFGISLAVEPGLFPIDDILEFLFSKERINHALRQLESRNTGGSYMAADFLLKKNL